MIRLNLRGEGEAIEYFLASLSERLQSIEQKYRRPNWSLLLALTLYAFLLGMVLAA